MQIYDIKVTDISQFSIPETEAAFSRATLVTFVGVNDSCFKYVYEFACL
jgi:hypothetical protein